ncbi:hypothetical protein [Chitinophaga sp. CF418]|uniref:hypothetical protein n=1 Tax=Chitinophaga sp. CF418 TaxID=1855287 RepID=UPI000913A164|nr:hypothetical protein [Chitinophaga sp. CF418]SHM40614.1 hypothetical protein SAMN05216311_102106 [Chitinophaga sp. CF418]
MELNHYIQSGIIESYVLGIATTSEMDELQQMRRLYPSLNAEVMAVERRMEKTALAEAVLPSPHLKQRIFQHINWRDKIPPDDKSRYTFINIHSKDEQHITVHKWWRLFFIITFILSKICLFFAIYFFLKYQQSRERKTELQSSHTEQVRSPK